MPFLRDLCSPLGRRLTRAKKFFFASQKPIGSNGWMWLDDHEFLRIISATPLVSIDLVIENEQKQVLLGKRLNRPAKGFWFVPGGRIRKNELVGQALTRLAREELGGVMKEPTLIGVFDHIYPDNFAAEPGINTHYVVIAYRGRLDTHAIPKPDRQHSHLTWWNLNELVASPDVHENTKRYFADAAAS